MLVTLHSKGELPAIFMPPLVNGDLGGVHLVFQALSADRPFYTFEAWSNSANGGYSTDVVEIARRYVDCMLATEAVGPYHLIGFSSGAQTAFAMARHIVARGAEVAFLGIIDDDADLHRRDFGIEARDHDAASALDAPNIALARLVQEPYPGKVTLFRASYWTGLRKPGAAMDWEYLAGGGVEVYNVPCTHADIVSPEGLGKWIDRLVSALDGGDRFAALPAACTTLERPNYYSSKVHQVPTAAIAARKAAKQGQLDKEIEHYLSALRSGASTPAWISINLADAFWQNGQQNEAIGLLEKANKHDTNIYYSLANMYRALGMQRKLQELSRCLETLSLDDPSELRQIAKIYLLCENRPMAERMYRRATEVDSAYVYGYRKLWELLTEDKRYEEAATVVAQGLAANPGSSYLVRRLGMLMGGRVQAFETKTLRLQKETLRLQEELQLIRADGDIVRLVCSSLLKRRNQSFWSTTVASLTKASGLFDEGWYEARNPDARGQSAGALGHFVRRGCSENRSPGPNFDADAYLDDNPDVRAAGMPAFVHYLLHGLAEGRPVKKCSSTEER